MFSLLKITPLILLGITSVQSVGDFEVPEPCDFTDFVSENCSREIEGAAKKMKL